MEVYPLHARIDIEEVKQTMGRFMVKDYVKSVKGTEFPRFFDTNVTQEEFDNWMHVFYKYRGHLLTGGICIKEYLKLKRYGDRTNEYRVFYINHKIVSVSRNSAQMPDTLLPPRELLEKYRNLGSTYYTVDYAELEDGTWKIMEAGEINLGTCRVCADNSSAVSEILQKIELRRKRYDPAICPDCGGKLQERSGVYGRFLGCINYPRCKYSRSVK